MSKPVGSWLSAFEDFTKDLRISSKEAVSTDDRGVKLEMWASQRMFLKDVAEGLDCGQRSFYCLKSRQLGITTVSLVIDLFWLAIHKNLGMALVTDDEKKRDVNRDILRRYVASFPEGYFGESFSIVKDNNKFMLFSNGSRIDFLIAGVKKKSTSWGEGVGYAAAHLTEVSSYADPEGLESFEESFAQTNPSRLFIYESTAKGFNHWRDKWKDAEANPIRGRAMFYGWWSGDTNRIERSDPLFRIYGTYPASGDERERVQLVQHKYGVKIVPEQLAWIRWKTDKSDDSQMTRQNQPWTAEEAFVQTGYSFFQVRNITREMKELEANPDEAGYQAYRYVFGATFFDIKLEFIQPDEDCELELKVWEEPVEGAKYTIGCDTAWGRNDHKDRSVCSIWRCYADKLVQVAEYASDQVEVKQLAWVLAHLAGAYRDCIVNPEVNGPGAMIITEWEALRGQMSAEWREKDVKNRDWEDALSYARFYLYNRPDSMGAGYAIGFECLALDTPLPTPTGWTTMGEVKEGDYLLSDDGNPTQVIGTSRVKIRAKCYEIEFDDGTRIVADANHWWKVGRTHLGRVGDHMRQTHKLKAGKFFIRTAAPLTLPDRELPLDPYLLGAWLGDGSSDSAQIFCGDADVEEMVENIEACGQPTRRTRHKTCWNIRLNDGHPGRRGSDFIRALKQMNVFNNKHIPEIYLRASHAQRLALLQGLMDTDGSATQRPGQCNFVTNLPALAAGFGELVQTLGFKAKFLVRPEFIVRDGIKKECPPRHQFWLTAYPEMPIFRLERKVARLARPEGYRQLTHHRIKSVTEVDSVPVRCIMVDAPSKMYLCGAGMIPTHNTTWKTKQQIMHQMRGEYVTNTLRIRSMKLLMEMTNVIQDGSTIGAPESRDGGAKDDRVFAAALAIRAWINWIRQPMVTQGQTYSIVTAQEKGQASVQSNRLNRQVYSFFKTMEELKEQQPQAPAFLRDRGLV